MKILVAAASKHGSTAEIAAAIARNLTQAGHDVDVRPPEQVADLEGVDVVVLGSAVYAGHWLKEARDFTARLAPELAVRPVWLFSSGPIGDPLTPAEDAIDAAHALEVTGARDHRTFAGRIDKEKLSFGERALVRALRAAVGDFRDWDEIAAWSRSIEINLAATES
ncbi:flavodoxin domain-containing protein [Pengzhenrongella frigida]|uniref:Flavodoxin n=1 Tax=Pengzhenrongella frigida TaxID=1259133 RepID=A0A4Q5N430_9MICO|nr:flavodoxin domain-containing protein [Cellulomonas sp. HLT2-17]RYV52925.1 flavodoxin [Cellulomonas sp. HLT2-17]